MQRYGPSHMLAFAFSLRSVNKIKVILINLELFTNVIDFEVVISQREFSLSRVTPIDVDFLNKRAVFSIGSKKDAENKTEREINGFFYLHIEAGPSPCITAPPINLCSATGTESVQERTYVSSDTYKHWDDVGQSLETTPS